MSEGAPRRWRFGLSVLHARLVLPLCVRGTAADARLDAEVATEGGERPEEPRRLASPRRRPMTRAPSLSIARARHTAEAAEGAAMPSARQSSCRPLRNARTKGRRENPSTAQDEEDAPKAPRCDQAWADVDLHLLARRRLERNVATWDARRLRPDARPRAALSVRWPRRPMVRSSRATTTALPSASP